MRNRNSEYWNNLYDTIDELGCMSDPSVKKWLEKLEEAPLRQIDLMRLSNLITAIAQHLRSKERTS